MSQSKTRWLLGYTKKELYGTKSPVFLYDFSWDCGWYWSGGYVGNENFHSHFDGCFLETPDRRGHPLGNFITPWDTKPSSNFVVVNNGASLWEPLTTFLDDVPTFLAKESNWWRVKDLFKQFYALREAAEVFNFGGHCTEKDRKIDEFNPDMAKAINDHIETVVIREIRLMFNSVDKF